MTDRELLKLAAPLPEPVAWRVQRPTDRRYSLCTSYSDAVRLGRCYIPTSYPQPLYTAPPAAQPSVPTGAQVEAAVQAFAEHDAKAMPHHSIATLLRRHRAAYELDARLVLVAAMNAAPTPKGKP